jgi:hypothetical protein
METRMKKVLKNKKINKIKEKEKRKKMMKNKMKLIQIYMMKLVTSMQLMPKLNKLKRIKYKNKL